MDNSALHGLVEWRMAQIGRNVDATWSLSADTLSGGTSSAMFHGRWIVDATGHRASIATQVGVQPLRDCVYELSL